MARKNNPAFSSKEEGGWYKRYPVKFLNGTVGMTLEEKGAYSVVLDLIYTHEGPIIDDPRWIAGNCGCSVRRWNALRETLISRGKIQAENGFISNLKADEVIENRRKNQVQRGSFQDNSGENEPVSTKNKDLTPETRARVHGREIRTEQNRVDKTQSVESPESNTNTEHLESFARREKKIRPLFEVWWELYPRKEAKKPAFKAFIKSLDKVPLETIMEGTTRYAEQRQAAGEPQFTAHPATWLNAERWADAPAPTGNGGNGPFGNQSRAGGIATAASRAIAKARVRAHDVSGEGRPVQDLPRLQFDPTPQPRGPRPSAIDFENEPDTDA